MNFILTVQDNRVFLHHVGIEHVETDLLLNDHAWIGNGPQDTNPIQIPKQ